MTEDSKAQSRVIVAVLAVAGVTVALTQTLVIPLMPQLPGLLGAAPADTSWVVTATLLSAAVANPVAGRLGDLFGKRRVILVSITLLVLGSALSALSPSLPFLVAGRALQGLGMGVIPLGISLMRDVLPAGRLGPAMALMSSSLGVGGALGLPVAAAVAQYADWRLLFWGMAGLSTIIGGLVLWLIPESQVRAKGRFDFVGALILAAGLVCLLLAISKGSDWGWGSGVTLGLFAAAGVVLLLWGVWELRHPAPLVDLRSTARRPVLMTNLASVVVGFSMLAMSLIAPQLLQLPSGTGYGLGQSLLAAGLWMAPGGLMMMVVAPYAARLSAARGPRASLMVGALIIAAGYTVALALMGSVWGVLVFNMLITTGVGFAFAAMPALIMNAVPASQGAAANGLNTLMRAIGTSMASAVIGVVLANMSTDFNGAALPSEAGFQVAFAIGAGAALVAAALVLAIPSQRGTRAPGKGAGAVADDDHNGAGAANPSDSALPEAPGAVDGQVKR